jgi:hypothetical protein
MKATGNSQPAPQAGGVKTDRKRSRRKRRPKGNGAARTSDPGAKAATSDMANWGGREPAAKPRRQPANAVVARASGPPARAGPASAPADPRWREE